MLFNNIYYFLKPLIPRSLQIFLRRKVALQKRKFYRGVWPINEKASKPPQGWSGWPEGKRFALVLTHDVDTARGQERGIDLATLEASLGFRSSFNFVGKKYEVSAALRKDLADRGFEVAIHGLYHDGKLYKSKKIFHQRAKEINQILHEWQSAGFVSPSMHRNLDWVHQLDVEYDISTFDTDPFEPQPGGVATIFPFWVRADGRATRPSAISLAPGSIGPGVKHETCNLQPEPPSQRGFVELPYTVPQDFTLFILLKEKNIDIWKKKLDWIAHNRGMALLIAHPDYMNFDGRKLGLEEYPVKYYEEFLKYVKDKYANQCWQVLPRDMARFWQQNCGNVTNRRTKSRSSR